MRLADKKGPANTKPAKVEAFVEIVSTLVDRLENLFISF
jgi:hypothetical protein